MKYPIYIPSLGRCGITPTTKVLDKEEIHYFLVVEKDEYEEYKKEYGAEKVLSLPSSKYGSVVTARNFCKEHATKAGHKRHWQLDDNITAIVQNKGGAKGDMSVSEIFNKAEEFVERYSNIGVASFAYTTFGFLQKKPFLLNKGNASCMLFLNNTPYRFNENIIEDTDYTLQVLQDGLCTVVFYAFLVNKMSPTKLKGGNTDTIHNIDTRMEHIRGMKKKYPELTKIVNKFGKPRIYTGHIWRNFKQPLKKV